MTLVSIVPRKTGAVENSSSLNPITPLENCVLTELHAVVEFNPGQTLF